MTSVKFFAEKDKLYGFEISGHSSTDYDDETGKIVCAAVSSAAYMAANTISEIIKDEEEVAVSDGVMRFIVKNPSDATIKVFKGLRLHLEELSGQYSNNIRIIGGANYVKD